MKMRGSVLALLIIALLAACAPADRETPEEGTADDPAAEPEGLEEMETIEESENLDGSEETPTEPILDPGSRWKGTEIPKQLEKVPDVAPIPAVVGEVPEEIMRSIMADFSAQMAVDTADIEVLRASAAIWNDGSLGCPKPGEMYTQAQVEGYWVVLRYQGKEYDYRVRENGYFFLCESPPPGSGGLPTG